VRKYEGTRLQEYEGTERRMTGWICDTLFHGCVGEGVFVGAGAELGQSE
jgi:hypothetical protein